MAASTELPKKETKTDIIQLEVQDDRKTTKQLLSDIKFYALPIFGFALFILILLGPVIDNINKIFANIDGINNLRTEDTALSERISKLIELQSSSEADQLIIDKINDLVPTEKSQVLAFRKRVSDLALGEGLKLEGSSSTEEIITDPTVEEVDANSLILIEIPSKFSLEGSFNAFRSFLNTLGAGADFFVVNEMNLHLVESEDNSDNWSSSFDLVKYQFFTAPEFSAVQIYGSVSEDEIPIPVVVEFVKARFLGNTGSGSTEVPAQDAGVTVEPTLPPTTNP